MLYMNILRTFDYVVYKRLITSLRNRKILTVYVKWIQNFLIDRSTTIKVHKEKSQRFTTRTDISQESSISLILFLFFIVELLKTIENEELRTSTIEFVDDTYIFIYDYSIERNCRILEDIYERCTSWIRRHDTKFTLEKYELIHFVTYSKKFNMKITINIERIRKKTNDFVRVLEIQVNSKLK